MPHCFRRSIMNQPTDSSASDQPEQPNCQPIRSAVLRGTRFGAVVAITLVGVCAGLLIGVTICAAPFDDTDLVTLSGIAKSIGGLLGSLAVAGAGGGVVGGVITGFCAALDRRP